jgi:hypothetical protein
MLQGRRSPVLNVVGSGGGRPLDDAVLRQMEGAFGQDFSDVRLHTGDEATRSAASVQASAYTVGSEIVLHGRSPAPGTPDGNRLLAHELTHVVQQREGPVDGTSRSDGIAVSSPADRFERAAETNADQVMTKLAERPFVAHRAEAMPYSAGSERVAQRVPKGNAATVTVQRETSADLLKKLATPQVREAPALKSQKKLVAALEELVTGLIAAGPTKDRELQKYNDAMDKWQVNEQKWGDKYKKWEETRKGTPPPKYDVPKPVRPRLPIDERTADFQLGGILIDAGKWKFVSPKVAGATSSRGNTLPEASKVKGLIADVALRTMMDAGQMDYLNAAGLPNDQWKIFAEVHYYRQRDKEMSGFHKDTQGQTLFVNLNYHVEDDKTGLSVVGPEYVLNPPAVKEHDEQIYGTNAKAATLPAQFTDDLTAVRKDPRFQDKKTRIETAGVVPAYGYVAFVDEAIHHATPYAGGRYVTPTEFRAYLKATYPLIVRTFQGRDTLDYWYLKKDRAKAEKFEKWFKMAWKDESAESTENRQTRYTRKDFKGTMEDDEFREMLEWVGKQPGAGRMFGGAGAWRAAAIPGTKAETPFVEGKRALVRRASDAQLTRTWPETPKEVPRRFLRTWVRAIPAATADQLRGRPK